jgi:DNA-binding transcriptional MerR regulator
MTDTYTPAEVAKLLDISPATVRRMCGYFAVHLSSGASPTKGEKREFTAEDVHILQAARVAMNEGKTVDQVNAALHHFALPPQFHEPDLPVVSRETPDVLILSQRIVATLETLTGYQETFTALAARLDALTSAQQEETAARKEQTATLRELIAHQRQIHQEKIAASERLSSAVHLVFVGILAVCIIVLLTLAVAIGWIG